ncbi:MAG: PDZ domain-containing protein [bacterium]
MLRFPDVSRNKIAFVYDNDVWIAPKDGGTAVPLSSPPGAEFAPKFSPDGQTIAFSANYDGNVDVYTIPVTGGIPKRLTYHPGQDAVVDFAPSGRIVFGSSREMPYPGTKLYYANDGGGLPSALPMAQAAFASFSADGKWCAFTPWSREWATWKRYRGGTATDIWLFNLDNFESRKITDHLGTDDIPMYYGNSVYYLSDAGKENRRNIWKYEIGVGSHSQITHFTEFDVKWPSIGPEEIVFEYGGKLMLLDLVSNKTREVRISIPGDHPSVRPQMVDVSGLNFGASISPGAKRVAVNFRGDIWTLPAEKGFPRNLTRSDDIWEQFPAWSPDGKWIAYFGDETGEYELFIRMSDGSEDARKLTDGGKAFRYSPVWSPDSKKIAFADKTGSYFVYLIDEKETVFLEKDPWALGGYWISWAPDGNWLAYTIRDESNSNSTIKLFELRNRVSHTVTSPMFNSFSPVFDKSGDFLYFITQRNFVPTMSDLDDSYQFSSSAQIAAMPLRKDVASPFAPENDEEEIKAEEGTAGKAGDSEPEGAKSDQNEKATVIDLAGLEARTVVLPLARGNYSSLAAADKRVLYIRATAPGSQGRLELAQYDLLKKEETKLLDGVGGFDLTPDGSKMLVYSGGQMYITTAGPGAALDKRVDTSEVRALIDPRREWKEVIRYAWRVYRDFFYDPGMHGVDWQKELDKALALVEHAASRDDVTYILGEMVGELNVGHAYVWSSPTEEEPYISVGLLGCDFKLDKDSNGDKGYRISKIYRGADWDIAATGPLSQPGVDVAEGDFLLAVNGVGLDPSLSPYAAFQGTAGKPTELTVGKSARRSADSRKVLVTPISSEYELRHRAWEEANRQYVLDKTGGRVGYIYVRNTSFGGIIDLERQFVGQFKKDALIIDERWNGGGFIPNRLIELLNRPIMSYWARRDGLSWRTPGLAHAGPKVMLINYAAGSGGDAFPYYFRQAGLGKLVGTRTWGGLVGLSGNPPLMDGGYCSVPTFGFYELDGTWGIEGHGVDPDVLVVDNPTLLANGQDPQLDAAIEVAMNELNLKPWIDPDKPAYPDRSGAGLPPGDK